MSRINKKIVGITVGVLATLFFILPAISFCILQWAILPPERLTPLVVEEANKFIEAHLECEKVELTYFETYPHLGIRLTNGRLISHKAEDETAHHEELAIPSDSLLCFTQAVVSLRPTDYLFGGKITIGEIKIDSPRFYGYVNKDGHANWDIYHTDDSVAGSTAEPLPPIDLQKLHITNGHFTYNDRQQDMFAQIDGFFLDLKGSLANGRNTMEVETGTSSILFRSPAYTLQNKLALTFKSGLVLSNNYNTVRLKGAELMMNKLPFTAEGSITALPEQRSLQIDMKMGLKVSDMNDLLGFIPDAYFQNRDKTEAKGTILLEGNILGNLNDSIVPTVDLCCRIDNGSYHIKGVERGIDTLQMDMDIHLDGQNLNASFISLETLTLKGEDTSLDMHGKVTNLMKNPAVDVRMKGRVDFTRLAKEFLNPDTFLLEGVVDADLSARFTTNDVMQSRTDRIQATGSLNIDNFKALSQPLGMDMYIAGASFFVGSTEKESQYLNAKNLLNATLSLDTLNIKYKDEISTNISKLVMSANTAPTFDTTAVIPLSGSIRFDKFRAKLPDSTWLIAGQTLLRGGVKGSASDKRTPMVAASIEVDTLKYFIPAMRTGVVLSGSTFNVEVLSLKEARQQRRLQQQEQQRAASSRQRSAKTLALPQQIQTDSADITNQLLRKWEVRGNVEFAHMRAFSRLFPIRMYMEKTNMKFNTNNITLSNAHLHLGKSDLTLNGELKSIRQALLRGGKLKGNFALTSDYLDCNELMQAMNNGMKYEETHPVVTASSALADGAMIEMDTRALADSIAKAPEDATDQLFMIPKFLDVTLHTDVKQIDFKDLKLEKVQGEVILRDQSANLSNLDMHSNIGCGKLTLVYTAKDKSGATAGFDLDMEDVVVDKLIGLFPAIDTLIPMLRSFEGVVDCQMTTTCRIDSTMSVVLPSVNSACFLHGKDMVLMDGETFTEISKTLMFKNKERNVIDSISVDLMVKDNKIEVYPFMVEVDRYRVAVGGTHNLDMTFNYHISVLKSPVPFKLGIDITGNLDDFKYKIVKCRYKDLFKPAKMAEMDSTRIDIRRTIRETIRKQIKEAAPELAGSLTAEVSPVHTHSAEEQQ